MAAITHYRLTQWMRRTALPPSEPHLRQL